MPLDLLPLPHLLGINEVARAIKMVAKAIQEHNKVMTQNSRLPCINGMLLEHL